MRHKFVLVLIVLLPWMTSAVANAASADWFPFVIPWDDSVAGTATDMSSLNDAKPAGSHGRIVVKDGHFVESGTGHRVRFLGMNMAAEAAFPTHEDAERIAASLAKYGINAVRLHHMDNAWHHQASSLIDQSRPDHQHFSAEQLDRLDYLAAALERNGIYLNINLKVSRQFSEADGFPASVNGFKWAFDKRVDIFCRRMIDLQKAYAHDLLTHVNPYTHLSYASDPGVAFVEINNENSILGGPGEPLGRNLIDGLPEPFSGELKSLWNSWLGAKYPSDEALLAAWNAGITPPGPPIFRSSTKWTTEYHEKTHITLRTDPNEPTKPDAAPPVEINVEAVDGPDWYVQAHVLGIDLQPGKSYTLAFRARADRGRSFGVDAMLDEADWRNLGLDTKALVGKEWKTFRYVFDCTNPEPHHARITFIVGNDTGRLWLTDVTLHEGSVGANLGVGGSLKAANIALPISATRPQNDDWVRFLADTESDYAHEMRNYLRNDLSVHANITDTQINYGGLTGLHREADSDYADAHAYWQHPHFPRKEWSRTDWSIQNTPLLDAFANGIGGDLAALARTRVAGKPFVVSEYDHPAPTDYACEMLPLLVTVADVQDWDGLYLFCMGPYGAAKKTDVIGNFFDNWNHPAKRGLLPTAAMIFRREMLAPIASTQRLEVSRGSIINWPFADLAWNAATNPQLPDALTERISIDMVSRGEMPRSFQHTAINTGDCNISIRKADHGAVWLATGPMAIAAVGAIQGTPLDCGPIKLRLTGDSFATATAVSLDGRPLQQSVHILLTVIGRAENQEMGWNPARTSVADRWGHGPVLAQSLSGSVLFSTGNRSLYAYSLDSSGNRAGEASAVRSANDGFEISVGKARQSIWYELVGSP